MKIIDSPTTFAQKVVHAINFSREHRSSVNDVFYYSSLMHVEKAYLDANIVPLDALESIKKSWHECFKNISEESNQLNDQAREHLSFWQELLELPTYQLH